MMNRWKKAAKKLKLAKWNEPMLRPVQYEVVLDAPGEVYYADQCITGHVMLETDTPVNLKGVKIRFKGECFVHFTDAPLIRKSNKKKDTKAKTRQKQYKEEKINLLDETDYNKNKGGWKEKFRNRKQASITPLMPSPSSSADGEERTKVTTNGISNGNVNHGYLPDSAITNNSGLQWTDDRRNGGVVHTPPDRSTLVNDVGAGHTHGLASRIMKNKSKQTPRRSIPSRPPPKPVKRASLSTSKSSITETPKSERISQKPDAKLKNAELNVSTDATKLAVENFYLSLRDNSDAKSDHSNISSHSYISNNLNPRTSFDGGGTSNLNSSENRDIFIIDNHLSNGQVHNVEYTDRQKHKEGSFNKVKSTDSESDALRFEGSNGSRKVIYNRPQSSSSTLRQNTMRGPTFHYWAKETYFDCEFYIYGHKYQKDEKELLAPGVYEFPFAFNLPPNLPPSFASEKGAIRYVVFAVLDRPAAANLVRKKAFNVHTILDLNMDSQASGMVSKSASKNLCGLFCDSGPITLNLTLPKKGYVPGEKILVNAEADNISGRSTKRTRLMLLQIITYIMPNEIKSHVEKRVVKEIVRGMIPPGESDFWEGVTLTVPPLAPSNIHLTGRLIKLDYKLEMVMELPVPWNELRVSIPIIIGSVPLRANFKDLLPTPETSEKQPSLPKISYADFPAYNFSECYFGRETLEGQYERLTGEYDNLGPQFDAFHLFAPSYISYTAAQMIHASRMEANETRPPTVVTQSRSGSKNGSLGSKGSRSKERKENGRSKKTNSNEKDEKSSKERLALSVINKIAAESEIKRRRKLTHQNAMDSTENIAASARLVHRHSDSDSLSPVHFNRSSVIIEANKNDSLDKSSFVESYDFDRSVSDDNKSSGDLLDDNTPSLIERDPIISQTFEATKVSIKGSFVAGGVPVDDEEVVEAENSTVVEENSTVEVENYTVEVNSEVLNQVKSETSSIV